MKVVLSWIKELSVAHGVDINLTIPELANRLTLAGLEVEEIQIIGLPMPDGRLSEYKASGLSWARDKIVTAAVHEVMPHPNADRLVLCRLDDGEREHIVLTGAPNLFPYKGQGRLPKPLKVAYAREGARIYDGHQEGQVETTLKRAKIRGVESYSMICSEKELGISEEHEGVILLDEDAPVGVPLADYMGDAVFDIAIIPNIARAANMLGVAREIAALTDTTLRTPEFEVVAEGEAITGKAKIEIQNPELNPRFVLGLIKDVEIKPSPYWMQRRLRLAGMRPINNIVDATNYAMLEIGEPLHAFDYDVLVKRAGGTAPTIITRTAQPGEKLTTLDDIERELDEETVLVCDTAGALSIAGVMGGLESEVSADTRNVLLEGAAWNYINIRRTSTAQRMMTEASYRFSRGVHPMMAERGVRRCLELMRLTSGGTVARGLVDNYPLPHVDPIVEVTPADARRWLGIEIEAEEIARILRNLEFEAEVSGDVVRVQSPDHRVDIGTPSGSSDPHDVVARADIMEEVARIYGYDRIPETILSSAIPPANSVGAANSVGSASSPLLEEKLRDVLVNLGLQEVATYRLTSPEREIRRFEPGTPPSPYPYISLANPIAQDRTVMRQSLLASMLEVVERNARTRERMMLFEIGPVYLASEDSNLPEEPLHAVIVLTGRRHPPAWQGTDDESMDFYDLKGLLEEMLQSLHISGASWKPHKHPSFHPGKCARIEINDHQIGVIGELHPLVRKNYELPETALLAAELDVSLLLSLVADSYTITSVAAYPAVLEDLAIVVDEKVPAGEVEAVIRRAGGKMLTEVRLFDVYRSETIGAGKKSLAYALAYQSAERTLKDKDAEKIRQKIIRTLEQELGAVLRS